jgi:hypothetical protein
MSEKNESANEKDRTVQDETGQEKTAQPYRESEDHVPDPTSVSGTLETSDTGGGHHSSLRGVSRIFGSTEEFLARVESAAQDKVAELVNDIKEMVHREESTAQTQQVSQQTTEQDGIPVHQGGIVQGDGTGHPEPNNGQDAAKADQGTPADQRQAGTADTSTEDAVDQSAPVATAGPAPKPQADDFKDDKAADTKTDAKAEQDAATGSKAPAKKTASPAKGTGSAKK